MSTVLGASCSSLVYGLVVVISICLCGRGEKAKHFNSVLVTPPQIPINANTTHMV